jgi:hypothetical protein
MTLTVLIFVTLTAGGIWYAKRANVKTQITSPARDRSVHPFAGVIIRCDRDACSGAMALRGQKLLAARAPALPLPYCSRERCRCSYEKLEDRREEKRRSIDDGIEPLIYDGVEQRRCGERRT